MSKFSNDGHKLNHRILSPCTKKLVTENLEAPHRVGCLKKVDTTFCGDGTVENGEDCDCGTILQCIAARSCCGPPGGSKPCKFLKHDSCVE
jgi:disintegrin and metalloproteinase domain-containing protein 10